MKILVFKTNITDKKKIRKLSPFLRTLDGIIKWNVDLHDCDKILRIKTFKVQPTLIMQTLHHAGFNCIELED